MARGKCATKAGNRRADEAAALADGLKATLTAERSAHHAETTALKTELSRYRNEMTRLVAEHSAAEVERIRVAAGQQVADLQAAHVERAERALKALYSWPQSLPARLMLDVAEVLGVENNMFYDTGNRYSRRRQQSNKKMRNCLTLLEDIEVAGRPVLASDRPRTGEAP